MLINIPYMEQMGFKHACLFCLVIGLQKKNGSSAWMNDRRKEKNQHTFETFNCYPKTILNPNVSTIKHLVETMLLHATVARIFFFITQLHISLILVKPCHKPPT